MLDFPAELQCKRGAESFKSFSNFDWFKGYVFSVFPKKLSGKTCLWNKMRTWSLELPSHPGSKGWWRGGIGYQLCEGFWWSLGQTETVSNDFPPSSRFFKKNGTFFWPKLLIHWWTRTSYIPSRFSCGLIQAQGSLGEITPGFWTKTSNLHVLKGTKDVQLCRLYQNSTPIHGTNHLLMFVAAPVQLAVPGSVPQGEEMKIDTTRLLVVEKSMFSFDS